MTLKAASHLNTGSITIIIVGNKLDKPCSNPGQGCLFHFVTMPLEMGGESILIYCSRYKHGIFLSLPPI